jgi:hypothetical protein
MAETGMEAVVVIDMEVELGIGMTVVEDEVMVMRIPRLLRRSRAPMVIPIGNTSSSLLMLEVEWRNDGRGLGKGASGRDEKRYRSVVQK